MNKILTILFLAILFVKPAFADKILDNSLVYYITVGKAEDIVFLLKEGANPNAQDKMKWSALALASERTDMDTMPIVKVLVGAGANVNYDDGKGNTPLIIAIKGDNSELVRYLISKGADFHVTDIENAGVLEIASIYAGDETMWILKEAFRVEKKQAEERMSAENFNLLLKKYSFYNCTHQYMDYFIKSGQEEIKDEKKYRAYTDKQLKFVVYYANQLHAIFNVKQEELKNVAVKSRKNILKVLNGLVSNKVRREYGVGAFGDIVKRCTKISNRWKAKKQIEKIIKEKEFNIKIELENIELENIE